MRLDLLLSREEFPDRFCGMLKDFFGDAYGWSGSIHWIDGYVTGKTEVLRVNNKLNIIYPGRLDKNDLIPVTAEYAYHPNPIRRLLQQLYVRYATSYPWVWLTTTATVQVTPWIEELNRWCLIPGNHSIRIVELDNNQCRVLLKQGFDNRFIKSEIAVRRYYSWLPVPRLLEWSEEEEWYLEERITGLPLNRIADQEVRRNILMQAQHALDVLYMESSKQYSLLEWTQQLSTAIQSAVQRLPSIYSGQDQQRLLTLMGKLRVCVESAGECLIETAMTHGDFQPANIMAAGDQSSNQLYLIDWEYAARRYHLYDAVVFAAHLRSPKGLAQRIGQLMERETAELSDWHWNSVGEGGRLQLWMVALTLMEDLLVRLQELNIPGLRERGEGLEQWVYQVDQLGCSASG